MYIINNQLSLKHRYGLNMFNMIVSSKGIITLSIIISEQ